MAKIVIAGGTGMIGQRIEKLLLAKNHEVFILTRSPKKANHIAWDLENKTIDTLKIEGTNYLINLCGENIGSKRWTKKRKVELHDSRIGTNTFLYEKFKGLKSLNQFLSASGINCYPLDSIDTPQLEKDAYGSDYLSQLVRAWEESADLFSDDALVAKIRISMVLDKEDGALQKLLPLAKWGVLSPMGNGKQWMNWVHIEDVSSAYVFAIENNLDGAFNLTGQPEKNTDFTKALLKSQGRRLIFPKIPSFVLKMILGEQATIVLDGVKGDNSKLKNLGFTYKFETIESAFTDLFG
jgi:uncharacterized protein (TIGR01777 family)|tara:strand:- start:22624 stop:23508 length:885 start_codon:yes stop_codon:yes gene_type:complete